MKAGNVSRETIINMIELDGSYGSGGGQIIRTAVGLAAFVNKPCKIYNIRAKRGNPGLREQHLQAINSVNKLVNGQISGNKIGSSEIEFRPMFSPIKENRLKIEISTAGSVGLVLQAVLIPAMKFPNLEIVIQGGATWGKWAVPVACLQYILVPLLGRIGYLPKIEIIRDGFYPRGGAEVKVTIHKSACARQGTIDRIKSAKIVDRGKLRFIRGISISSLSLKKQRVAERQRESAEQNVFSHFSVKPHIDVKYVNSICPGSGIQLFAIFENSIIGANSLGELGKKSETVGKEVAEKLLSECSSNGAVDSFAGDQLLPFLALAVSQVNLTTTVLCDSFFEIKVSKITDHCRTNAYIIEKFLPVKFDFENNLIRIHRM